MRMFFDIIGKFFKPKYKVPDYVYLGIGNIGAEYEGTRHNIGFDVLYAFEKRLKDKKKFTLCKAAVTEGFLENNGVKKRIWAVWPKTYVNRSGVTADCLKNKFDIGNEKIIVIVDDFHLKAGTLRIRKKGSSGGHNGLKSLISVMGEEFVRIRVGVGPLPKGVSVIDFVLGRFDKNEEELKKTAVDKCSGCLEELPFVNNIDTLMNKYN